MKKLTIVILAIVLLISGCNTVLKSGSDLANIAIINDKITSGEVSQTIKYADLSLVDDMIVDHAINSFISFADKWKRQLANIDASGPVFVDFLGDYNGMIAQYNSVEIVIAKNWSKYPSSHQIILLDYQLKAKKANDSVDSLIRANKVNLALIDAVILAKLLAGLII